MKKMYTLPQEDILCREGQTRAFLRPYTKDWDNPESDSLHLEYSYTVKTGIASMETTESGFRIMVLNT